MRQRRSLPLRPAGAERVGVRWGQRIKHHLKHTIDIVGHFGVPKPDNAIARAGKLHQASCIGRVLDRMLPAVQLDHQLPRWAVEVCDERADRMLAAKFLRGHCGVSPTSPQPSPPPGAERELGSRVLKDV